MGDHRTMRFTPALLAACAALFPLSVTTYPQDNQDQQSQSVADAARQARAAKKNAAAKPAKVISDDDIDPKNVKPGAEGLNVGSPPTSDAVPPAPARGGGRGSRRCWQHAAAERNPPVTAGESPEIARAKEQVVEVKKELDLSAARFRTRFGFLLFQARLR